MKKIILAFQILFVNLIFCQENFKIIVIDSITQKPIENVKISNNALAIGTTNIEGIIYLPKSTNTVIVIKDFYYDLEIKIEKSQTIKLNPILSTNLDEVVIKTYKGASVLDKIYNVYKNSRNYNMQYKIKNVSIKFAVNNEAIIDINEILYNGLKVQRNANRFINTKEIPYDNEFYRSINSNNIPDNATSNVVVSDNSSFEIPFFNPYFKRNYSYFNELHEFFNNTKKFKYSIEEDDNNYLVRYTYKDNDTKFTFNIALVVDKINFCIISYKKNLIPNKNTNLKVNLVNTQKVQNFHCEKFDEEVIFKINNAGIYDLVSESMTVEYNIFENKEYNFIYQHVIEPSISFTYDDQDLIGFIDVIKKETKK